MIKSKNPFNSRAYGWKGWIPFWIASGLVLVTAILPQESLPPVLNLVQDTVFHAVEYFLLFFFSCNAFRFAKKGALKDHPRLNALGYCLFMGALSESLQFFAPTRFPEFSDWVADGFGALFGLLILYLAADVFHVLRLSSSSSGEG